MDVEENFTIDVSLDKKPLNFESQPDPDMDSGYDTDSGSGPESRHLGGGMLSPSASK